MCSSTPWAACASASRRPTWRCCWPSSARCAAARCRAALVAFGEVGLAGEVRPAPRGQERLREAAKLGFSVAVVPRANAPKKAIEGLTVHAVDRIEQAIEAVRGL
jgi:predicted ATP-dependent serine protease